MLGLDYSTQSNHPLYPVFYRCWQPTRLTWREMDLPLTGTCHWSPNQDALQPLDKQPANSRTSKPVVSQQPGTRYNGVVSDSCKQCYRAEGGGIATVMTEPPGYYRNKGRIHHTLASSLTSSLGEVECPGWILHSRGAVPLDGGIKTAEHGTWTQPQVRGYAEVRWGHTEVGWGQKIGDLRQWWGLAHD